MKRRFFLMTAAAACAAPASDKALAAIPGARREIVTRRLLAALERRASAAEVGRAYLAGVPREEADRARLVDALTRCLGAQSCDPARAGKADLRAALTRQIRQDFADRQVVRVDGWVLSVTEARLAGLAALAA